MIYFVDVLN